MKKMRVHSFIREPGTARSTELPRAKPDSWITVVRSSRARCANRSDGVDARSYRVHAETDGVVCVYGAQRKLKESVQASVETDGVVKAAANVRRTSNLATSPPNHLKCFDTFELTSNDGYKSTSLLISM